VVATGVQRQRLEAAHLDDAAGPPLGGRLGVQPLQQPQGPLGGLLGEQHPHQHQVLMLAWVAGLVLGAEAASLGPADGGVDVALGQGQPGPLGRHRVEQADDHRAEL
jgi:hypothetical protein